VTRDPDKALKAISDLGEWGQPVPARRRKSEKRRRGVVVSVRLTPEEFELLDAGARQSGQPLGTFMRQQALASATSRSTSPWEGGPQVLLAGNVSPSSFTTPPVHVDQQSTLTNAGQ
jgi:hypothetical protein